jgi:predicted GH43/DUF377 family glycosyl hydrolase
MYISFENYQFEVRLNNKNRTVYIENKHDETYIIRVPLDFKDDELIQYLKTNVKKLIQDFEKQQQVYIQPKTIKIYNKEFLYVHNPNAVGSFKKNNSIIISSHSLRSHKQIIKDLSYFLRIINWKKEDKIDLEDLYDECMFIGKKTNNSISYEKFKDFVYWNDNHNYEEAINWILNNKEQVIKKITDIKNIVNLFI